MRKVDQDLLDASENGDLKKAKGAIENGADVNVKNADGNTPLHWASENGHEAVVSFLLEKGADVNAKSKNGSTPLHWASWFGHEAVVSPLLESGADVNAKNNVGWTPLHYASGKGHQAVLSLLLDNGANVNAKNNDGETPLHWASYNGKKAIVSLLLENGADSTITNKKGKSPLQLAQENDKQNCVAAIEQFLHSRQQQQEPKRKGRSVKDWMKEKLRNIKDDKTRDEQKQIDEEKELERRQKEEAELVKQELEQKQREKEHQTAERLKKQETTRLEQMQHANTSNITIGTVQNDQKPEAVIHVYDKNAALHLLTLLQDIDNTNVDLSTVKDIVEILGEDRKQFETLLIQLKQVGFVTRVEGYEMELQQLLDNQRASVEDARERQAIRESEIDYEFYLHLQWKLSSMIQASECIACGMVKQNDSFREGLIDMVTAEGFLSTLEKINFVKTLSAAVRTAMRQFEAIPGMHAARKAVKVIMEFSDDRSQKMAMARAAIFSTLIQIREGPSGSLNLLVEKAARLLVRCNVRSAMYGGSDGGKVDRAKGALLTVLGDLASSSAGQKATIAADKLYRIVVQPPAGSIFKIACEDKTSAVPLDVALVATFLKLPLQEITSLGRFCLMSGAPRNTTTAASGVTRLPTTSVANTANYEVGGSAPDREVYAALQRKQEEHDRIIQYLKSKLPDDSDEVMDGYEIDVGGGLKQMLLPKKPDEESEGARCQDESTEKRFRNLEVFVDVLVERLSMTELNREEILLTLKEQNQNQKADNQARKKKGKSKRRPAEF